ncbi:hypothetical protein Trydic_g9759 [Trypoxylus dichotomus]
MIQYEQGIIDARRLRRGDFFRLLPPASISFADIPGHSNREISTTPSATLNFWSSTPTVACNIGCHSACPSIN